MNIENVKSKSLIVGDFSQVCDPFDYVPVLFLRSIKSRTIINRYRLGVSVCKRNRNAVQLRARLRKQSWHFGLVNTIQIIIPARSSTPLNSYETTVQSHRHCRRRVRLFRRIIPSEPAPRGSAVYDITRYRHWFSTPRPPARSLRLFAAVTSTPPHRILSGGARPPRLIYNNIHACTHDIPGPTCQTA